MYCRLWRYPDIQSHHELKQVDHCSFAFQLRREEVCVNPYHYTKVDQPTLPAVMVPTMRTHEQMPPSLEATEMPSLEVLANTLPDNTTFPPNSAGPMSAGSASTSSGGPASHHGNGGGNGGPAETPPPGYITDDDPNSPASGGPNNAANNSRNNSFLQHGHNNSAVSVGSNHNSSSLDAPSPNGSPNNATTNGGGNNAPVGNNTDTHMPDAEPVMYCEPAFWCTISYYELNTRVGETFHGSQPSITVDGFTDPGTADR